MERLHVIPGRLMETLRTLLAARACVAYLKICHRLKHKAWHRFQSKTWSDLGTLLTVSFSNRMTFCWHWVLPVGRGVWGSLDRSGGLCWNVSCGAAPIHQRGDLSKSDPWSSSWYSPEHTDQLQIRKQTLQSKKVYKNTRSGVLLSPKNIKKNKFLILPTPIDLNIIILNTCFNRRSMYKQVILISSNTYPEEKQILDHPQGLQLAHLFHSIGWKQKNITRWNLAWNTDLKISAFLFLIKKKYCHWILTFAILLYHKMLLLIKVNLIIDQLILLN